MSDIYTGPVLDPVPPATQYDNVGRTILRTIVQWVVGLALGLLVRKLGLDLTSWAPFIIDGVTGIIWLLGTATVTWIMTRPRVAKFLAGSILAPSK